MLIQDLNLECRQKIKIYLILNCNLGEKKVRLVVLISIFLTLFWVMWYWLLKIQKINFLKKSLIEIKIYKCALRIFTEPNS